MSCFEASEGVFFLRNKGEIYGKEKSSVKVYTDF